VSGEQNILYLGASLRLPFILSVSHKIISCLRMNISGPRCSQERDNLISSKVATVSKFCTADLYRVSGDERFLSVFCFYGLPVCREKKTVVRHIEHTSSKFKCWVFCMCIQEAPHFSPG
jgi:hypothetical protein